MPLGSSFDHSSSGTSNAASINGFCSLICNVVPQVLMVAGNEIVVESGARVDIRCQIRGTTQMPKDVGWYRNGQELVGIIYTSKAIKNENSTDPGETYFSTYLIPNARMGDSGNYTCRPQHLPEASIQLHVTRGRFLHLDYYPMSLDVVTPSLFCP